MERLQKVMAHAGIASRRKCEEMIINGRVKVNGQVVKELGYKVKDDDFITVDGKPVQKENKVYILLNKPKGVLTSLSDPFHRPLVTDLIPHLKERVYPVGRLDYDTEGLLVLTNDGELAYRMIHPRYEMDKEYIARVKGKISLDSLNLLRSGVPLEDGMTFPAEAEILKYIPARDESWLKLIIHEGRKRQVRRMCEKIGHPVHELERVRIAFLTLEGVPRGEYRYLTEKEVRMLKSIAELS
ncbi:rRNA pseudouridine synthase [Microaerobacter geothermalis]|uniref:pseudouridine synthase n=1 Tax=Microaerobacter geothermalis TaxID=674972 RepID=UPI001F3A7A1F|nr:pseudouridine synthase [Microaerobacter geothermalis]MCF6093490.1 rRNA pseudouridine synthase [Microaerobacter geothermalis]